MENKQTIQTIHDHGYEFKRIIGKGGFSTVYLCYSKKYNQDFAIKQARKDKITKYEFDMLVFLNHPNIIRIYDVFEDESSQYLVMEYCPNGTILQKGKLEYDQFVSYSKQILDALDYCHSKNIAHRDIKPENILIDNYNKVKLADFGIAKNFGTNNKSKEKCGTMKYFAPEMFLYNEVCPFKADIWALGITFYCMATGKYPFSSHSPQRIKQSILIGEFDFIKNKIDQRILFLINKMTESQPSLRPTPKKIQNFQIFQISKDNKKNHIQIITHKCIIKPNISSSKSFVVKNNYANAMTDIHNEAPLTKMNSYKSFNHLPGIQQINGHMFLTRI